MNQVEVLQKIVARLGETKPDHIGPEFSLQTHGLNGSLKRAALAAAIRRELGVNCPAAHSVATFAELERAVLGQGLQAPSSAPPAPLRQTIKPPGLAVTHSQVRCGVDIETISALPETADFREHEFYRDTFTPEELAYCILQENPRMHFAARWCVKEALIKCDPEFRGTKMADIEVVRNTEGEVSLRHRAEGSSRVLPHAVSLSHTDSLAVAVVVSAANGAGHSNGPGDPALPGTTPETSVPTRRTGSVLPLISALAWLVAVGLAVVALLRTLR